MSEGLTLNLRTVRRIREQFGEPDDYEGTAERETLSDKKRTPHFVGEIKTMIGRDPWKSMRSTARDTGVSEMLVRQTVRVKILGICHIQDGRGPTGLCTIGKTLAWLSGQFQRLHRL